MDGIISSNHGPKTIFDSAKGAQGTAYRITLTAENNGKSSSTFIELTIIPEATESIAV
jgi:hypothetical protein